MPIKLPKETERQAVASIKRYFLENLDEEIGELKAGLFLDFCLREICPCVYNQAIADAQTYLRDKAADMDGICHEPEFGYWKKERKAS